jgi:hypothetical protein
MRCLSPLANFSLDEYVVIFTTREKNVARNGLRKTSEKDKEGD